MTWVWAWLIPESLRRGTRSLLRCLATTQRRLGPPRRPSSRSGPKTSRSVCTTRIKNTRWSAASMISSSCTSFWPGTQTIRAERSHAYPQMPNHTQITSNTQINSWLNANKPLRDTWKSFWLIRKSGMMLTCLISWQLRITSQIQQTNAGSSNYKDPCKVYQISRKCVLRRIQLMDFTSTTTRRNPTCHWKTNIK